MVLQALNQYYQNLLDVPNLNIPRFGFASVPVSAALILSPDGELLEITRTLQQVTRGKKIDDVKQIMLLPEPVNRSSGIQPNFLWDNCAYVLGISTKDKPPSYALDRHNKFCEFNLSLLQNAASPAAEALRAFLKKYDPLTATQNPVITREMEYLLEGGNLIFKIIGDQNYLHRDDTLVQIWLDHRATQTSPVRMQCLITGETAPTARLHNKIKNVRGAQSTGAAIVSFNERAYESYNRTEGQGLNSPVSEQAAFAYTTALNHLLSRESRHPAFTIGDTTVVYWAERKEELYTDLFSALFGVSESQSESHPLFTRHEQDLQRIADCIRNHHPFNPDAILSNIDHNARFFVLGLSPNAARLSIRFFFVEPFNRIISRLVAHYQDLQIQKEFDNQPDMLPPWMLMRELVSQKSSNPTPPPLLFGALMRAVFTNTPYPAAMYYALLNRIRADVDEPTRRITKINYARAAMIKAYLLRANRNNDPFNLKEVLTMALNETSSNSPYLLGRLFAVLEKAQQDAAAPVKLNATIKDRFFTSACASPVIVFPLLMRLNQHHLSKAKYGFRLEKLIGEIMGLMPEKEKPFPSNLNLQEQGAFILGYYHQRQAFFTPRQDQTEISENQNQED